MFTGSPAINQKPAEELCQSIYVKRTWSAMKLR
jgi:hypothetical protein